MDSLIESMSRIPDEDLHDYISETGGKQLLSIFTSYNASLSSNTFVTEALRLKL